MQLLPKQNGCGNSIHQGLVNIAPVSDGDSNQLVLFRVELVNDAKISHPQPERIHALHPMGCEIAEISPKSVNFRLNLPLHCCWQDEKAVTERAYENPVFVEDLVRNVALRLNADARVSWYKVEAENFESIHNHNAYACIEKG